MTESSSRDRIVPSRLPQFGFPNDHGWNVPATTGATDRVSPLNSLPTWYCSVIADVWIVRTPPDTLWVKAGTLTLRLTKASVARSSNEPVVEYSMRITCRGVRQKANSDTAYIGREHGEARVAGDDHRGRVGNRVVVEDLDVGEARGHEGGEGERREQHVRARRRRGNGR